MDLTKAFDVYEAVISRDPTRIAQTLNLPEPSVRVLLSERLDDDFHDTFEDAYCAVSTAAMQAGLTEDESYALTDQIARAADPTLLVGVIYHPDAGGE